MSARRRVDPEAGHAALELWLSSQANRESAERAQPAGKQMVTRSTLMMAVRYSLEEIAERHPGRSVEVRVPPAGAVQIRQGSTHRRGTPPAVVETDMETWMKLVTGLLKWSDAWGEAKIQASGEGASLEDLLPIFSS